MITSTRSMHYQVSTDHRYARICRLVDGERVSLFGIKAELMARNIRAIEMAHTSLGSKPSQAFCQAFDHMCAGYYSA